MEAPETALTNAAVTRISAEMLRDAYHGILEIGLENLQRFRLPERFDYLALEIDHLHNLPHYMYEENVYVHAYYYCTTRPFYIECLGTISEIEPQDILSRYNPYWDILRAGLMPFADSINAKHYTERL
ncbi:MAG: hypothetical protein JWM11_7532 [Planctomycetaceae bacterium]|nr:hypothetical protein [Planctomycetaceae bacterium]